MTNFFGTYEPAKKFISQANFFLPEMYTAITKHIFMSSTTVVINQSWVCVRNHNISIKTYDVYNNWLRTI